MSYNSKYSGEQVESLLDRVASGGGGGSSDSDRKEVIYWSFTDGPIEDMRPNVVYWYDANTEVIINSFEAPPEGVDSYDEFTVVVGFGAGGTGGGGASYSLTLPSNVMWANGNIPDVSTAYYWELSISRISDGYGLDRYFAVLTPFKEVE